MHRGNRLIAVLSIAMLLIAGCSVRSVLAQDTVRLVNLGEGRNLIARTCSEGVVRHFMGMKSLPDDHVVLLPNRTYIADLRWFAGAGTVVVAANPGEVPVDVYGFDPEGRRLFRRRSRQEEEVRLHSLPGDSLVVVSSRHLAKPPEVLSAATGESKKGYLSWPTDRRDSRGCPIYRNGDLFASDAGLVVMADRDGEKVTISAQDIGEDSPLWELHMQGGFAPTPVDLAGMASLDSTLDTTWFRLTPEESVRPIASGANWEFFDAAVTDHHIILSGVSDGDAVLVSLDRAGGRVSAAVRLPIRRVSLVAEPGGDRLLAFLNDGRRGHIMELDQSTFALRRAIANHEGWYFHASVPKHVVTAPDGIRSLVPVGIGGGYNPDRIAPQALVVSWGETASVQWLNAPAAMIDDGRILVAREYEREGGRGFEIEEWRP